MSQRTTIRQRFVQIQVVGILGLGAAILATTFLGASTAVRSLNRALIDRAVQHAEAEVQRFFEPLGRSLFAARAWGQQGLLLPTEGVKLDQLFRPFLAQMPQLEAVLLVWESGEMHRIRPQDPEPGVASEPLSEIERASYEAALGRRNEPWPMVLSPVHRSPSREGLVAIASAAWESERGPGVVTFEIAFDQLLQFTRGLRITQGGAVAVMTNQLELLALPDDPRYWMGPKGGWLLLTPDELGSSLVEQALDAFREQPEASQGTPVRFFHAGASWWSQVRQVALGPEDFLLVAVMVPTADLMGDRVQTRRWILALTAFVLLGALAGAWMMARRVSEPIEALVRNSERMSAGNLEPGEVVHAPFREVEALAGAQEHLRESLKSLTKIEGDLLLARRIQQRTLPRELPRTKGFDLAAWSEQAEQTGGDAFDVFLSDVEGAGDSNRVMLVLADASGHGIGPALSVTQLRAMLRVAARMGGDLAETARLLNRQLWVDLPKERFITCWMGEIHPQSGMLRSLSAGQAPLIHYLAANDEIVHRMADAPPFGVVEDLVLPRPHEFEMEPNDVFAVLSDGIFEARSPDGRELGRDAVSEVVASYSSRSAEELAGAIREQVERHTEGAAADDDRTVLLIRRT